MLRWLKTVVVSDVEKAHVMRQVGIRKTIVDEVSLLSQVASKPGYPMQSRDESGGCPFTGQVVSGMDGDVSLVCCSRMEQGKACSDTAACGLGGERERPKRHTL